MSLHLEVEATFTLRFNVSLSELIIDDDCFAVTQSFEGDSLLF